MGIPAEQVQRIAGFELNALRASAVLGDDFENVAVPARGTPIHDLDGSVLYYRLPLRRGRTGVGYADVAADDVFGEPLLATSMGLGWDEKALLAAGTEAARKQRGALTYDAVRFVAYSFPKLALQFLAGGREILMLELYTWAAVPPAAPGGRRPLEPSNFERWSLLGELPQGLRRTRAAAFTDRLAIWQAPALRRVDATVIALNRLGARRVQIRLVDTREIRYSVRDTDHHPCYELRGQQTGVWCVAASTEMLLDFYRYGYDQVRIATELKLGTLAQPNGLPYGREGDVVTVIEALTSNALDATMHKDPDWALFHDEIKANRPVISFIPGHSRTVVGYTHTVIALPGQVPFKGLLVYDPWPPNTGVITRWENFATQVYRYAYSSVLHQV